MNGRKDPAYHSGVTDPDRHRSEDAMLVILGASLGAAGGGLLAWRRKGKLPDILLYTVVFALIFALAGLFLTLILHRMTM